MVQLSISQNLTRFLVCGGRPAETDSSIIYCAEAAFSAKCQNEFDHHNVIGNHVPDGKYYYDSSSKTNTGAFVFYNGKWKFLYDSYAGELTKAAKWLPADEEVVEMLNGAQGQVH